MSELRLQKWLSTLGVASRREAERMLTAGRITVNGETITQLGTKVNPETDEVRLDGKRVGKSAPRKVHYLLCKPDGVLTTRGDPEGRPTVFDLPSVKDLGPGVFSVGRLDFHTEGLLLLSNDGELVHRLMHPKWKLPRHYYALVEDRLSPSQEARVRHGMELDDGPTQPVDIEFVEKKRGKGAWYRIVVHEGRNRLVRRLFETHGLRVLRLIRYGFGAVRLPDNMAPGEVRPLHRDELVHLMSVTGLLQEAAPPQTKGKKTK